MLNGLTPLPSELTLDQLKPILLSVGLDVDALLPVLVPSLSPEDRETLLGLASQPITLQYGYTFSGSDSVEPSTGSIVEVRDVVETLWASPDPAVLDTLRTVLGRYPNVEAAVQAVAVVEKLAAEPIRVFTNEYAQTEESVADIVGTVKDAKRLKQLAESTIPQGLLIGGIVLAVLGLLLALWPKRKQRDGGDAPAAAIDSDDSAHRGAACSRRDRDHQGPDRTDDAPLIAGSPARRAPRPREPGRHPANVDPNWSRRTFFCTFAIVLRGSSSTHEHPLGLLEAGEPVAERAEHRRLLHAAPGAGTTAATTASPKSGWGTPNTADSTTPGSSSMASSTSFG